MHGTEHANRLSIRGLTGDRCVPASQLAPPAVCGAPTHAPLGGRVNTTLNLSQTLDALKAHWRRMSNNLAKAVSAALGLPAPPRTTPLMLQAGRVVPLTF